jgi:hypothetical protein
MACPTVSFMREFNLGHHSLYTVVICARIFLLLVVDRLSQLAPPHSIADK